MMLSNKLFDWSEPAELNISVDSVFQTFLIQQTSCFCHFYPKRALNYDEVNNLC